MVEALKVGRGRDRFRQSLLEAAALGVNMSVPYGAWMGSEIEDAFYAPHEVAVEIQSFLADHEDLFTPETLHDVGVVFSIESNYRALAAREVMADNRTNELPEGEVPFGVVCQKLSDASQPYDVVFFPDGTLRTDSLSSKDLKRYRTLVLPECRYLTTAQASLIRSFIDDGGRAIAVGVLGENLPAAKREELGLHEHLHEQALRSFNVEVLQGGPQVRIAKGETDMALTIRQMRDGSAALHLIRYDYDDDADRVPLLDELALEVRLPFQVRSARASSPVGSAVSASIEAGTVVLRQVPLYSVVLLAP
jgi:hypothetical protein